MNPRPVPLNAYFFWTVLREFDSSCLRQQLDASFDVSVKKAAHFRGDSWMNIHVDHAHLVSKSGIQFQEIRIEG